jgi:methionine sulfoxide reductase heme-binding subunit
MSNKGKVFLTKVFIHLGALIPLVALYVQAYHDELGADPVESIIHFTGIGAFNLLLITLSVTPLSRLNRSVGFVMQTRRLLGIYCSVYATCHLINFLAFEVQFNFNLFFSEIIKRPYITVGMLSFLLLAALTVTSLDLIRRNMGKRWQQLHNGIYVIALLTALHFYWSVKSDFVEPLIYIAITLFLLSLRYKKFFSSPK